jgi:hypothetical protein
VATIFGESWPPALVSWPPAEPRALVMLSWIRPVKIEPRTATPREPPMLRAKVAVLVATPRSRISTLFCAIRLVVPIRKPRPEPTSRM